MQWSVGREHQLDQRVKRTRYRTHSEPEQKAGELRSVAQSKDHDLTESAENVSADVGSKTRNWMTEAEAYVRENPLRAVLIAFAVGLVLAPRK
jgi:ElaB/YqjD/DUF883 family membrane-anchored ribosome-binding protein